MIVDAGQQAQRPADSLDGLEVLGSALRRLAEGADEDGLRTIAEAVSAAIGAEVVVLRLLDELAGVFEAHAVAASSTAVAAELQGSRLEAEAPARATLRPIAERLGFDVVLEVPIVAGDRVLGRLELLRRAQPFTATEEAVAHLASAYAALALGGLGGNGKRAYKLPPRELLRLGG